MDARSIKVAGLLMAAVAALGSLAAVAIALFPGGSAGGTLATGRSVMTHSDSLYLFSQYSRDTATIRTAGMTIVVQPRTLLVDGRAVAAIAEQVRDVDVTVDDGAVTFVADGAPVPLTRR